MGDQMYRMIYVDTMPTLDVKTKARSGHKTKQIHVSRKNPKSLAGDERNVSSKGIVIDRPKLRSGQGWSAQRSRSAARIAEEASL